MWCCCIASASLTGSSDGSLSSVNLISETNSVSEESEMESPEPSFVCGCFLFLLSCFARPKNPSDSMRMTLLTKSDLEDVFLYRNMRINLRYTLGNLTMVNNWDDADLPFGVVESILPPLEEFLRVHASGSLDAKSRLIGKFDSRFPISQVYAVRNALVRWEKSEPLNFEAWPKIHAASQRLLLACGKSLEQVFAEPEETACCCLH